MAKPTPIELEVIRTTSLTEHMLRVTLGGDALASFPEDQESAYIKLIFPQGEGQRPILRTYTIRHQRPTEIDVDFALHDAKGPALTWAANAQPGDRILVGGPGPKKLIQHQADWFLLAGDMSALPAISVNLSKLPADAVGYAVIEVLSESDIQSLDHPEKMDCDGRSTRIPIPTESSCRRKSKRCHGWKVPPRFGPLANSIACGT
ncbi:Vibriobactin utilization protein ViuB [Rosistilla ulvae]|uniref:Vibriobactin utilization protein ViuB n=1 Tax=Rosistilla ulvae TaxID=1930277 RepID=A0A517M2N4_9BACT|nr:Vibriobactin utilization protein ViuB [Rosistilla ulvae]